jgi:hypothetical protein
VALLIVVENEGTSDAQVTTYGRGVLAEDREVPGRTTATPRQSAFRTTDERLSSWDRLVVIAVSVVLGLAIVGALLIVSR